MLNKQELRDRIENGLITGYVDLEKQLTPQGFDFSVQSIEKFEEPGRIDFDNSERQIPESSPVEKDGDYWKLEKGVYKIIPNESVNIPEDLFALAFLRSSMLRMGCDIVNGVWDAGFEGKGVFTLEVMNPQGVEIKQDARVNQIVFFEMEETEKYSGVYTE
jgi:dUTP pyrophosphatase